MWTVAFGLPSSFFGGPDLVFDPCASVANFFFLGHGCARIRLGFLPPPRLVRAPREKGFVFFQLLHAPRRQHSEHQRKIHTVRHQPQHSNDSRYRR